MLFVRKNALQILIPKYGLEKPLFFDSKEEGGASAAAAGKKLSLVFNESEPSLTVEGTKFRLFDQVLVKISIEQSNIQQSRLKFYLVSPVIDGVSVKGAKGAVELPPKKKVKCSHGQ